MSKSKVLLLPKPSGAVLLTVPIGDLMALATLSRIKLRKFKQKNGWSRITLLLQTSTNEDRYLIENGGRPFAKKRLRSSSSTSLILSSARGSRRRCAR